MALSYRVNDLRQGFKYWKGSKVGNYCIFSYIQILFTKKHLDAYFGRQQSGFEVTVIDLMKYLATKIVDSFEEAIDYIYIHYPSNWR